MIGAAESSTTRSESNGKGSRQIKNLPSFSVVVCTRNRPDSLLACISSVVQQAVKPVEIIIVDDGQLSEEYRQRLGSICDSARIPFNYLHKDVPGLTRSRNMAVRKARGEIIQFFDDDVTLEPDFCQAILQLYADDTDKVLLGTEGTIVESKPFNWGARITDWIFHLAGWWALKPRKLHRPPMPEFLKDTSRAMPVWNIVGATMAFRRSALQERKFDETLVGYALGEDRDMAYRIGPYGWIARVHQARAIHHVDPTSRPHPFKFGQMVVRHYMRIMTRAGLTGVGDRLIFGYSMAVIALSLLPFALVRPQHYLNQFWGMFTAGVDLIYAALSNQQTDIE